MNIILSGMPGSGKSTVSKELSRLLGYSLLDTDAEIVKKHGVISEIFSLKGEAYFRSLESQEVELAALGERQIVSTGGGCLLRAENVAAFKKSGKIVYLKTSLETLKERLKGDTTRPLLAGDLEGNLKKLFSARAKIYEEAADIVVETDGLSPREVAQKILELVQ